MRKHYCLVTGGLPLTISGYGFKQDAEVTIDSAACEVQSVTASAIVCTVPHSVSTFFLVVVLTFRILDITPGRQDTRSVVIGVCFPGDNFKLQEHKD